MRQRLTLILALLILTALPCEIAWAGDIQGTVTIRSKLQPRATGESDGSGGEYDDDSSPSLSRDQEAAYVVISLSGKNLPATARQYVVRQKGREFIPHVLPIVRGSSVLFTNEDPFFHSIYSQSPPLPFTLPKYSRAKKEVKTFDKTGVVEIFCSIHSRMNAYIYVAENDFVTLPAADRTYTLRNIPAGTYTLHIWHPRAGKQKSATVTVPASGTKIQDLTI